MEAEIYVDNGIIQKKTVSIGSAIKYGRNSEDIMERYSYAKNTKNKDTFINDKLIEDFLKTTYFKFGIIPKELFIDLDENQNDLFYLLTKIDKNMCSKLESINLPNVIIDKINSYIDTCHTYSDLLFKNYDILTSLENSLVNKLDMYRNKFTNINSRIYFDKLLYFNRIRNFINEIKHERIMDFEYFYSNLLKFKYFTLLEEENVLTIHQQYLVFESIYNDCHQKLEFLDENNETKYFEIKNGSIKIDALIDMLKKYIDLF